MSKTKFYICEHCGNLVSTVHDAGVPLMCCGRKMTVLEAGTVEASAEKHIPVITVKGTAVSVEVGSVAHPMVPEHSILWVQLETDRGVYRKELAPGDAPQVLFCLCEGETPVAAYAYCNLHGLWSAEVAGEEACPVTPVPQSKDENYTVCNCNKVSYLDILHALEGGESLSDVLKAFEHVKDTTHCSTGCGGCHDKVMAMISDALMGH